MDLESATYHHQQNKEQQGGGHFDRGWSSIKAFPKNVNTKVFEFGNKVKKLGGDDPRRVVHSLKVGLALTLASLFYYYRPLYESFGVSAMWAIMTVVLIFEFSVGATLGKGVNRGVATLLAATLAVGAHHLANLSGRVTEPIVLGFLVFVQAAVFTFARFDPKMKPRYDYGLMVFILTFSFVTVSGYGEDQILKLATMRISTILIGAFSCIIVSILVFPVWAGEELHNLIASNIENLGSFLEGFGDEYFEMAMDAESKQDKSLMLGYITVLSSKNNEDALANFARWEPGHGRFQFRHPWKQYLKIGALTRKCACRIETLSGYLNPHIQAKPEIRGKIQDPCTKMSSECGKALKELAFAIKTMTKPFPADIHIGNSKSAAENLNSLLKSSSSGLWDNNMDLLQVVPVATVASLLIDVVKCTDEIAESVGELASMVNFKDIEPTISRRQSDPVKCSNDVNKPSVIVVIIGETRREEGNSCAPSVDNCGTKPTN